MGRPIIKIREPEADWALPPAEDMDRVGCQTLLAAIVATAASVMDIAFFHSTWFSEICDWMGWDADWVRDKALAGGVDRTHGLARVSRRGLVPDAVLKGALTP